MVHGVVHGVVYGFGVCINDVVYYLDFGGGRLVRLSLSIGVWFWMRYGDVINGKNPCLKICFYVSPFSPNSTSKTVIIWQNSQYIS